MLFFVAVALSVVIVVLAFRKCFALGPFFFSAGVIAMAGCGAAGGLPNSDDPVSLRVVTLDETPIVTVRTQKAFELTAAGYRAKSISIQAHRNELAEIREHIKYELRRGNITAERATTLNHLVDQIELEASVEVSARLVAAQQNIRQRALVELTQAQAKLRETLADTTNLVKVLGSVSGPEFAGTFIAAKIQVLRLLAEKAAVDGSIDEIRQSMKRPKAG